MASLSHASRPWTYSDAQDSLEFEIFSISTSQAAATSGLCHQSPHVEYFCVIFHYKIDILSGLNIFILLFNAKLELKNLRWKSIIYITALNDKHQKYVIIKNEEKKVREIRSERQMTEQYLSLVMFCKMKIRTFFSSSFLHWKSFLWL